MLMHGRAYLTIFYSLIIVYLVFIASQGTMQKTFPLLSLKELFTREKTVRRLSASSRAVPNVLAFESFLIFWSVSKLLYDQLLMILQI